MGQEDAMLVQTFELSNERLDRYTWYMSHRLVQSVVGMDADDFHQIGLIKLYELCGKYGDKPNNEFDAIYKRALFNAFMDICSKSNDERAVVVQVDLETVTDSWGYDAFEEAYLRHYQQHLEKFISEDAAVLLEFLLNPTPAVYHMHNIQRMRREALQRQGQQVRVPQKLTQTLVGKTIGFSASKTKALLREIRTAWAQHCQSTNWKPSAATS